MSTVNDVLEQTYLVEGKVHASSSTRDKKIPTLISNTVSNADEITRWLLDWHEIPYREERHAPGLHVAPSNRACNASDSCISNNPVYIASDTLTYGKEGFFKYIEPRAIPEKSLLPSDSTMRRETIELYRYFLNNLWRPVDHYFYNFLLFDKNTLYPIATKGVPFWEKLIFRFAFSSVTKAIYEGLEIEKHPADQSLEKVDEVFSKVEELLADGRPFLMGEQFTIADIFFAVNAAPMILPPEFGGSQANIDNLPDELQKTVNEYRARPAGQFALKIYAEKRPSPFDYSATSDELGVIGKLWASVKYHLFGARLFSWAYCFLAKYLPVVKLGKNVLINRYHAVQAIGQRDEDFTIKEINAAKMEALYAPFFLGMDRGPQHDREFKLMQDVARREDLDRIRQFVKEQVSTMLSTLSHKTVDVPQSVTQPVLARLIDNYFGVPLPSEHQMVIWMSDMFQDLFLNLSDDKDVHKQAFKSAGELKLWLEQTIAERKKRRDAGETLEDNILNRMIIAQTLPENDWLDDDAIRRNISGLIVGTVETTSGCVVNALDEIFRRKELVPVIAQAFGDKDLETVRKLCYEVLRFNPFNPFIARNAAKDLTLQVVDGKKPTKIKKDSFVMAGIVPAMFDETVFTEPKKISTERDAHYLHFGVGYHECYGRYINSVTIPEMVGAIISLKNIRRSEGIVGKAGLKKGPFIHNFVLDFD